MTKIYTLSDPETGKIRYVGKTIETLNSRLAKHICDSKRRSGKYHTINWINTVLERGLKPKIELLDEVTDSEWKFWEKYWVKQIKAWGFNLTNYREGGEDGPTGYTQGSERIQKRLETLKTSTAWTEFGKKHSETMKQKYLNGEMIPVKWMSYKDKNELETIRLKMISSWKANYYSNPENALKRASWSSIPIIAIFADGTKKTYNSAKTAATDLLLEPTSITFVCKGKGYHTGGVRFKYASEELQKQYPAKLLSKHTSKGRIPKK
jgi:hypothetical protein